LGIETVLLGVGYKAIHSPQEHIALSDVADLAANVYSIVTIGA
jgi:putative aminopeptidase FrvX